MLPVLIHDGDCGFCTRAARWIAARWAPGTARSVASQDLDDATLAGWALDRTAVAEAAWWVDADGRALAGDRAIGAALRAARGWPRTVGRLLGLPGVRSLAPIGYALVARNRHRLPGSSAACAAPTDIT